MEDLKILTINCQKAYQSEFKDFMLHILGHQTYDFILIQEVTPLVLSIIAASPSPYKVLNPADADLGKDSGVAIIYKESFFLQDSNFVSFAKLDSDTPAHGWGFVTGFFSRGEQKFILVSAHLHPVTSPLVGRKELKIIKEKVVEYAHRPYPLLIGGDFNTGLLGEIIRSDRIFSPEFTRTTRGLGPTLNSRYTEHSSFLLNKISTTLAKIDIGFSFYTDHVYLNRAVLGDLRYACRVLPDRVSDHSPVEVILSQKKQG